MCMERDGCNATLVTYKGIDQVSEYTESGFSLSKKVVTN